ncbi:hypothetical protein RRG08_009370 [Elysia crispata]|uniref:Uncharacterized protein n=1 Tax=Elysia crispata TaxID=231223 RepID=A0AAE1AFT9_9GAST|nr:hypothetical protein RRG08_009370 [Elysia crispata]
MQPGNQLYNNACHRCFIYRFLSITSRIYLCGMRFFKPITCSVMPPATISATATPVTCPSAKTATSDPSVSVSAVCSSSKPAFCPSTPTTVTFTSTVIPASSLQRSSKSSAHSAVQESLTIISDSRHVITTREKLCNRFSDSTCLTVLALQAAGVAASKCSTVIDVVSRNLFGQKLDLPSASTAENISDEAHVLSKVHATEKVLNSSDGSLINLGFSEVATEDSETLSTTTINLLDELSDILPRITSREGSGFQESFGENNQPDV